SLRRVRDLRSGRPPSPRKGVLGGHPSAIIARWTVTWMDPEAHVAIVIGSSRGLGAALAAGLVARRCRRVIGVSRTRPEAPVGGGHGDGRYHYVALDVTAPDAPGLLRSVLTQTPDAPLLVIYNAAAVRSDLGPDGTINFAVFDQINAVGVTG